MMYRIGDKMRVLSAFGFILLLGACNGPVESVDGGGGWDDAFNSNLNEALDNPCVEDSKAFYVKVDGSWRFRPCDGCDSISIEALWGGNTGQHLEIEQTLDAMSAELRSQEISMLQYSQHTGECP